MWSTINGYCQTRRNQSSICKTAENINTKGKRNVGRQYRKNRTLKCMTFNTQSIINKFCEFKLIIRNNGVRIDSWTHYSH